MNDTQLAEYINLLEAIMRTGALIVLAIFIFGLLFAMGYAAYREMKD